MYYFFPINIVFFPYFLDYFFAIVNLSFWNKKQQKNSQENSLGSDQNFGKNSFKITLEQL